MELQNKWKTIAVFSDVHALLEPLEACLEDTRKRKVDAIYSLGDNIGLGPNPREVLSLLKEYNVQSIAGNYEDHVILGTLPYSSYMTHSREENIYWMIEQISKDDKEWIRALPHCIEITLGGRKIAFVHFANDVRFDFYEHSAIYYPEKSKKTIDAYQQFLYTNDFLAIRFLACALEYSVWDILGSHSKTEAFLKLRDWAIKRKGCFSKEQYGYVSYLEDPLFFSNGKLYQAKDYDAVIQGHVHFKIVENTPTTMFYSMRALAMGYPNLKEDLAHYILLHEKENGFDIEEVYVPYNKEKMKESILSLKISNDTIRKYTKI